MIKHYVIHSDDGTILQTGQVPESMFEMQKQPGTTLLEGKAEYGKHYVVDGEIHAFTPEEQASKDNLPFGWVWKMPERAAYDLRTEDQRNKDIAAAILTNRAANYPPLTDLADAMYWQSQGDNSKMLAYTAAVAAVKAMYPKLPT